MDSCEKYLQKHSLRNNMQSIETRGYFDDIDDKDVSSKKGKGVPATPALDDTKGQCPYHLRNGCNDPTNCNKGKHDANMLGKLKGIGGGKGAEKGKGKGGKKGGKKGEKGGDPRSNSAPPATSGAGGRLPDDALTDSKGRMLCFDFAHQRCKKGKDCERYHGPATKAMTEHRKRLEEKWEQDKAKKTAKAAMAAAGGDASCAESGAEGASEAEGAGGEKKKKKNKKKE